MDFSKLPGGMVYKNGGFEAIHADWPIYPKGHGWDVALLNFANFPRGTIYYEIDDIDRCILFLNIDPAKVKNPFDSKFYHIAIWHEDLIELKEKGFIDGVFQINEYEFQLNQFKKIKKVLGKNARFDNEGNLILSLKNGKDSLYKRPKKNEYDDGIEFDDFAHIPNKKVQLTDEAYKKLTEITNNYKFSDELSIKITPLLEIKYFDTTIREASLLIETKLKKFHGLKIGGQKLIEHHINYLKKKNDNFLSAYLKCYRGELRTVFKYIRNEFAHNFVIIDKYQCIALLSRINQVLKSVNEIIEKKQ